MEDSGGPGIWVHVEYRYRLVNWRGTKATTTKEARTGDNGAHTNCDDDLSFFFLFFNKWLLGWFLIVCLHVWDLGPEDPRMLRHSWRCDAGLTIGDLDEA